MEASYEIPLKTQNDSFDIYHFIKSVASAFGKRKIIHGGLSSALLSLFFFFFPFLAIPIPYEEFKK